MNKEALRYIENSKEILSTKAQKNEGYYTDKKYIKMAGHTAYSGVLVALDALLEAPKKGRKSVEWYKEALAKYDKRMLNYFNDAYEILHLLMSYDGYGKEKIVKEGLESAEKLIEWSANQRKN